MKKNAASLIVGFILILLGLSIFLDNFKIFNIAGYILRLWPLILVYFGVKKLIKGRLFVGLLLLTLGVFMIISNFNLINFNWFLALWPALIIIAGLNVIIKAFTKTPEQIEKEETTGEEASKEKTLSELTILGDNKRKFISDDFKGGSSVAVLGSAKFDMTACKIPPKGATLEVVVVLGDTYLNIPQKTNVKIEAVPVLGSIEDHRMESEISTEGGVLYIKAVAVMGAIHIKSE